MLRLNHNIELIAVIIESIVNKIRMCLRLDFRITMLNRA